MKKLLIALPFLCMLVACAKKVQLMPGTPYCQVVSVNDSTGKPMQTISYGTHYNIKEIRNLQTNTSLFPPYNKIEWGESSVQYKYDNHNRLDTLWRYIDNDLKYRVAFKYDINGNIESKTSYQNFHGTLVFKDSCIYTLYSKGRPAQMRKIYVPWSMQPDDIYTYVYDGFMNRTETYLTRGEVGPRLIEQRTFDLSLNAHSIHKYMHLSSVYTQSDDHELLMAGAMTDHSLAIETKKYKDGGELMLHTKVVDVKTTVGHYPRSWKLQTIVSDGVPTQENFNFSHSCE